MNLDQAENAVANFIQKSFEILEVLLRPIQNKEYEKIIQWAQNGK